MENIDSVVAELQKDVKAIKIWIEKRGKRPDLLFREEWMDGRDVQLALSISTRTLRTLRTSGILIPTRLGKKYYYKTLAIKSLMEENYTRNQLKQVGRGRGDEGVRERGIEGVMVRGYEGTRERGGEGVRE